MTRGTSFEAAHAGAGSASASTSGSPATTASDKKDSLSFVERVHTASSQAEILDYLTKNFRTATNTPDHYGFTPLFWAERRGFSALIARLKAPAAPTPASYLTDGRGRGIMSDALWCTPEGLALITGIIERDEVDALPIVLKRGSWPSLLLTTERMVLAAYMAKLGRLGLLELLLRAHPEDANAGDKLEDNNTTPLIEAARAGHVDTVKLLLRYGADPSFKNFKGETAESVAKNETIVAELAGAKRAKSSFTK